MPDEPIPVIPLGYAPPAGQLERRQRVWRRVVRVCAVTAAACCATAWALIAFVDVESVLATGPLLFALGAAIVVGGVVTRHPLAWAQGLGHCGICVLLVVLVNLLDWSPREATLPFTAIGGVYTVVAAAATAALLLRTRPTP